MASIRGAIIPAVVIIATVEAPMASFRMQAMMKGIRMPMPGGVDLLRLGGEIGVQLLRGKGRGGAGIHIVDAPQQVL